jgi:GTPase SAR1 family protein
MGNSHSVKKNNTTSELKSKYIDKQIEIDRERAKREVKILLLGAGETGKSTMVKQMKILHQNGFTQQECVAYRPIIIRNLIVSLASILNAMKNLRIKFDDDERINDLKLFTTYSYNEKYPKVTINFFELMKRLWLDRGTQACFQRSCEYQLDDSAS